MDAYYPTDKMKKQLESFNGELVKGYRLRDIKEWAATKDPGGACVTTRLTAGLVDGLMDNGCGDTCAVMVVCYRYDSEGVLNLNCLIERNTYYVLYIDLIRHILDAYDPDYQFICEPDD